MQNAAAQRIVEPLQEDATETKKSPELHEVEETLSEFERATLQQDLVDAARLTNHCATPR